MFYLLLCMTLMIALGISHGVIRFFDKPVVTVLGKIADPDVSAAWVKYLRFAVYVVGVSGGVRIYQFERYLASSAFGDKELTAERWTLEAFRTAIDAFQAIAWMLLAFFAVTLIASVVLRLLDARHGEASGVPETDKGAR